VLFKFSFAHGHGLSLCVVFFIVLGLNFYLFINDLYFELSKINFKILHNLRNLILHQIWFSKYHGMFYFGENCILFFFCVLSYSWGGSYKKGHFLVYFLN